MSWRGKFKLMRDELRAIGRLPEHTQHSIKRNMREGLLCACNAARVPYFGRPLARDEHGHGYFYDKRTGIVHGYDTCGEDT